jgi:HAE1 family hydrophobic/amphiphilic exporter-1
MMVPVSYERRLWPRASSLIGKVKSYLQPLVIIVAIPLVFIGVVLGHLLMGLELSMTSIMGFVSLAGVVVNDSILVVTFIQLQLAKRDDIVAAAKTASRLRFRAVFLTSLTTIMDLKTKLYQLIWCLVWIILFQSPTIQIL